MSNSASADLTKRTPEGTFADLPISGRWTIIAQSEELQFPIGRPFEWRGKWLICDMKVGLAYDCVCVEAPQAPALPETSAEVSAYLAAPEPILLTSEERREQSAAQGFTGDECNECGNFTMVRNGTCLKCNTCGATTGCS